MIPTMAANSALVTRLDETEARRLCAELYWQPSEVRVLTGYVDANVLVRDATGNGFVLKVAAPTVTREELKLQERVLTHLASAEIDGLPQVVRSRAGRTLEEVEISGARLLVRMLTYLPGHLLAELPSRPAQILFDLGRLLGRLNTALTDFDEPAARRRMDWDVARLGEVPEIADAIEDVAGRRLVQRTIERYLDRRAGAGEDLRRAVIHGDAHEYNVLVSSLEIGQAELAGLIDFGDVVETDLVVEPAVAMAYAGIESDDPWAAALPVLAGYDRALPLGDAELDMLFPTVCARLALSVSMSAQRTAAGLADEYSLISEAPAWAALGRLAAWSPEGAAAAARQLLHREGNV